ncbi:MAG TPA: 2-phospho-L-lactate guanylyltransferase [Jiangellaceae bacterium]|nr:2-phospho-L-lactate guanylyltransferase [Jiangellaceae bacterium]
MNWSIVIPVKRPEIAKTRLSEAVGELRPALARAFAADTVAAALASPAVELVIAVTDDAMLGDEARRLGAVVIADAPDAGLNAALRHGADEARSRRPDLAVAALSADLPALRPDELATTLAAAAEHPVSFVADQTGLGTTVYGALPGAPFWPRFGGRSRAAHRAAGAVELTLEGIPSVRRDVDTEVDLWDALRLGVGPRTKAIAVEL